ncbi:zinc finger protein 567 isoform X1 [Bombus vosnesenskii]|uniref:Zinc finger protein 567 isoform X1 n=1 Tax=Bombus vosnesenskii TaxID=207650 RepID=A0A6J3KI43_9HYME|nr:zinc finger protein 567 isoform X1 [Bombus vosnesenskii]
MKIVCAAKTCKYSLDNEDSTNVKFIHFPNSDTSKIWAHQCDRTDLLMKSNEELYSNYYICSHHIEDRYFINKTDPVIVDQHAIPTLFESDIIAGKDSKNVFDKNEQTEITDNVMLSYCDMDVEMDQYHEISIKFSNLCRICEEPCFDGIEIFSLKGIDLRLREKISLHLPIMVDMEDIMPQKLCMNCYNKLEVAHSLVITSLRTDMRLKKFLNINAELNYDHKYSAIAKKCSLEIDEEMSMNETTDVTPVELSSSKMNEISMNQEVPKEFSDLENTNMQKDSFQNSIRKEVQSELNSFIASHNEEIKEDECTDRLTKNYSDNEILNNEIQCLYCKNMFKTQEMFENHKMLCDGGEIVVQKEKEANNNMNDKESNNIKIMNFQFITKTCNVCHENFETEKHFVEHKLSYCKFLQVKDYQITDKIIMNKEQCNNHKDFYNTNNPSMETNKKCGHCGLIYITKKELLNHIMDCHEGQLLFKCIICDRSYEKWSSLDVHEATHRIDKPYLCDLCGKSFKHSNNLRGHKRTHLDDSKKKRHICDICGNAFRSRFHLGEHMNQHNGNKPYSCEKCGKAFYKRIQLRQHKLSHGLNKHVCPICGTAFNRKGNMNTHLKRHNSGNGIYTCSICTHTCKSMSELKLHRKKHIEQDTIENIEKKHIDKPTWKCKSCDRIFSTRAVLLNHERTHKEDKISIDCNICGKKLASKNSLVYHKKSIHSSERPYMCQYCEESFVSKESRLIHERIHTGERPYVCKICKMEYKCSSNLNQHIKIHSGIKPYICIYCNKSFTRRGTLNVHERIHTGEKPFACETCGRTFSQKNDMIKHTKTHNAKSLSCEQCNEVFTRKKDILKHIALHEQNNPIIQEYVEIQQEIEPYSVDIACSEFE